MQNRRILTFFLICFYILVSINAFAAKITGKVTDEKNEPLIGAFVILKNTDKGVQTDVDGNYEITNVEDGTYEVLYTLVTFKKVLKTVTISKGQDVVMDVIMKEEGKNLKEVTIKTNKVTNTENAVLMEMRKSNTIVSGISSQQIQKTMDRNAADVVKRVPGVTIMNDQFIMVRGLYDRYNSVWLNDIGAPSSEVDKKSFSFDMIPSGQIDRILVFKTPAPELPGDFSGGMVKIYTTSIPDKNVYNIGFSMSNRQNSTGSQFNYNEPSKTDWMGYDDGKRSMPDNLPDLVNKSDPNQDNVAITKSFRNNWIVKTKAQPYDIRFNASAGNVFKIKKLKIGNTFGVTYSNTRTNFNIDRSDWDSVALQAHFNDQASVNNVSVALMDNVAVSWGNNKVEFKNLYNQFGKSSLIYRTTIPDSLLNVTNERYYVMGYESRAVYNTQLTGTHKSNDDNRKYTWALGYTDLFKNMPDLKRLRYDQFETDSPYVASVSAFAETVIGGGRVFSQLYEKLYCFNHHFSQGLRIKNFEFEVVAGNFAELKKRAFKLRQFAYTIKSQRSLESIQKVTRLKRLPVGELFADENTGSLDGYNIDESTNDYDQYDATNRLIASYVALKIPLMRDKMILYGGVRHETNRYRLLSSLNQNTVDVVVNTDYFLPSLNASYNISPKQLVRVAYGKTLNRPEFRENSPFYFYDLENRWGVYGAMFPSTVNKTGDTLDVAQIQNLDARWEWYPSNGEMVQAGVFYKHIKNPIQGVITTPYGPGRAYTYTNLKEGMCYGLEIDVRKNLVFFDEMFGSNLFKDFSFVGNAAFIKSEVTPDSNVKTNKVPLQGQSPYMFNAGLFYQGDSLGFQGTIVYNVFGPRIFVIGETQSKVGNIWEMPFQSLDIVLSKTFYKRYSVTFGIQNLLNSSVRQYQDVDYDNKIKTDYINNTSTADRPVLSYKPGSYYTFGVKMRI